MKKLLITLACCLSIMSLSAQEVDQYRPFQMSLISPIGTNGVDAKNYSNAVSINLLGGYSYATRKFEIGGLYNINLGYTKGLQIAGLFNYTKEADKAYQIAGIGNFAKNGTSPIQIGGIFNHSGTSLLQIAGISNSTKEAGLMQISGISNISEENALQIGGISNISRSTVLQASGISNVSEDAVFQIGGISNVAKNGLLQASGISNVSDAALLQFGGISNISKENVMQVSGISNVATHSIWQISGIINKAKESIIQTSGMLNIASSSAIQLGGIGNITYSTKRVKKDIDGNDVNVININGKIDNGESIVQVGGIFNYNNNCVNTQVAGVLNIANEANVQIGLFNYANRAKLPIGLVSIVKHGGKHELEVSFSEALNTALSFKLGVDEFYTIFSGGVNFLNGQTEFAAGLGFGSHYDWNDSWGNDMEIMAYSLTEDQEFQDTVNMLYQLKYIVTKRLNNGIQLFAGPVLNVTHSKYEDPDTKEIGTSLSPWSMWSRSTDHSRLNSWIGITAGIRY